MPIVDWDDKKLKEYNGELDPEQHQKKQKGLAKWSDLLRKDQKNPDIAVARDGRMFVRLSSVTTANKAKVANDARTIYDDNGNFWGELVG